MRPACGLWFASLLAVCLAACRDSTALTDLSRWGLPLDITKYQNQIESLRLPEAVDRLDWLPQQGRLRILNASSTSIHGLSGLPATVTKLDLSYTQVSDFGKLPEGLTSLDVTNTGLHDLNDLPRGLSSLAIGGREINNLDGLPPSLVELKITDASIHSLEGLPSGLKSLALSGLTLGKIEQLPASILALSLKWVAIEDLRALPGGLQFLEFLPSDRRQISLEDLPPFLVRIIAEQNYIPDISKQRYLISLEVKLTQLRAEVLPETLSDLKLDMARLVSQPSVESSQPKYNLPKALLSLSMIKSNVDFLMLPSGLRTLDISECDNTAIGQLPGSLKELNLSGCSVNSLRDLPLGLKALDASGSSLNHLDDLPASLSSLTLHGAKLTSLPSLPSSLKMLDVAGSALIELASLPPNLESLNVSRTGLQKLPPVPASLKYLDISNSKINSLKIQGLEKTQLVVLRLGTNQVSSLSGLPRSVRVLEFHDQ